MTSETTDDGIDRGSKLLAAGLLHWLFAFTSGWLWMHDLMPGIIFAMFGAAALILTSMGFIQKIGVSEDMLRKSQVSETSDEDPRPDRRAEESGDGSVRPGESVSQEDLAAISDEHDVDVVGVDTNESEE
jgi:hypothetical protein